MLLDYPDYTNKTDETLKSSGNTTIPEGTKLTWKINTKSTNKVSIYSSDTLNLKTIGQGKFEFTKQLFNDFEYTISTSNQNLKDYENLSFSIQIIKDEFPELNLQVEKDSTDNQTLYFFGQVNDDYGLTKLQMVYYPSNEEENKSIVSLPVSNSNYDEFINSFPDQLILEEGVNYELYFQVFDNDVLHNFKSVKSDIYSYRKLTKDEEELKQLNEQKETIKDFSNTFDKLKKQDKQLEEFSKSQKEKQQLNFNDKKKFENFSRGPEF